MSKTFLKILVGLGTLMDRDHDGRETISGLLGNPQRLAPAVFQDFHFDRLYSVTLNTVDEIGEGENLGAWWFVWIHNAVDTLGRRQVKEFA